MPPTQNTHHSPWLWTVDDRPPLTRQNSDEEVASRTSQTAAATAEDPSVGRRTQNQPPIDGAKVQTPAPKSKSSTTTTNTKKTSMNNNNKKQQQHQHNNQEAQKMHQGKITEYFKTHVKTVNGFKKGIVSAVNNLSKQQNNINNNRTVSLLVDQQTQFNSFKVQSVRKVIKNSNNCVSSSGNIASGRKTGPASKTKKFTPVTPRKILPAPAKSETITIRNNVNNIINFPLALSTVNFTPNLTYLHTKVPKPPDNIFAPQFASITDKINAISGAIPIINRTPATCLNVIHHHHQQIHPKMAAINNFNCVKLNGTVVPIVKLNSNSNMPLKTTNGSNHNHSGGILQQQQQQQSEAVVAISKQQQQQLKIAECQPMAVCQQQQPTVVNQCLATTLTPSAIVSNSISNCSNAIVESCQNDNRLLKRQLDVPTTCRQDVVETSVDVEMLEQSQDVISSVVLCQSLVQNVVNTCSSNSNVNNNNNKQQNSSVECCERTQQSTVRTSSSSSSSDDTSSCFNDDESGNNSCGEVCVKRDSGEKVANSPTSLPPLLDYDSGVSSVNANNNLEISVDFEGEAKLAAVEESQKSPILSKPKTIRFPFKQHKVEREKNSRISSADSIGCRWADCDANFDTNGALLEHLQHKHVISQTARDEFTCYWSGCKVHGRTSCSRSWLERHVLAHAGSKLFRCIVDGCRQRFNSQLTLQRHVNNHFNTDGKPNDPAKKTPETTSTKLFKRNGKKIRFRRQPWSARMFDFIDSGIMEGLQHKLMDVTQKRTLGNAGVTGEEVSLQSQVLARRIECDGVAKVLIRWHPRDIVSDEWINEKDFRPVKMVQIPSLNASAKDALKPTLCLGPVRTRKQRRKPTKAGHT